MATDSPRAQHELSPSPPFMHYLTVYSGSANRSAGIRVGLNTAVMPDPRRPYQPRKGPPAPDWTPLDRTLRTDSI